MTIRLHTNPLPLLYHGFNFAEIFYWRLHFLLPFTSSSPWCCALLRSITGLRLTLRLPRLRTLSMMPAVSILCISPPPRLVSHTVFVYIVFYSRHCWFLICWPLLRLERELRRDMGASAVSLSLRSVKSDEKCEINKCMCVSWKWCATRRQNKKKSWEAEKKWGVGMPKRESGTGLVISKQWIYVWALCGMGTFSVSRKVWRVLVLSCYDIWCVVEKSDLTSAQRRDQIT